MQPLFAFVGLGWVEMVVIALVVLLLFGSRLPSTMRSLGLGISEFKKGMKGLEDQSDEQSPASKS